MPARTVEQHQHHDPLLDTEFDRSLVSGVVLCDGYRLAQVMTPSLGDATTSYVIRRSADGLYCLALPEKSCAGRTNT